MPVGVQIDASIAINLGGKIVDRYLNKSSERPKSRFGILKNLENILQTGEAGKV